jgi:pimeloyl-ACP methyl ester carboxylesterase
MRAIMLTLIVLGTGTLVVVISGIMVQVRSLTKALMRINVRQTITEDQNTILDGMTFEEIKETITYTQSHTIGDGIERVVLIPKKRQHNTPLLFLHGMWHGAWCWAWWQELFAEWGWESHAFSLPGHGRSPEQRLVTACTLDYYASFLRAEIERFDHLPVLIGHSMGGAIAQWYLKYVRNDLPGVILVASWPAHNALVDGLRQFMKVDPWGMVLAFQARNANPYIRSPQIAAKKLISQGALLTASELHAKLGPESLAVIWQHNPPMWTPAPIVQAPTLCLAGQIDTVLSIRAVQQTAEHYGADFLLVEQAAHNLMMERNYDKTARRIHEWLGTQAIR